MLNNYFLGNQKTRKQKKTIFKGKHYLGNSSILSSQIHVKKEK